MILDEDLNVISSNAVGKVRSDEEGASFPWIPDLVKEVDNDPEGIDEEPSLLVLQETLEKSVQEANKEIVKKVAEKMKILAKKDEEFPAFNFFTASTAGRLATRVRDECGLGADKGELKVALMDIGEQGYYEFTAKELTEANVEQFLQDFHHKKLTKKTMGGEE